MFECPVIIRRTFVWMSRSVAKALFLVCFLRFVAREGPIEDMIYDMVAGPSKEVDLVMRFSCLEWLPDCGSRSRIVLFMFEMVPGSGK